MSLHKIMKYVGAFFIKDKWITKMITNGNENPKKTTWIMGNVTA